ncbi:unnamed protein product [Prunus brigantina]
MMKSSYDMSSLSHQIFAFQHFTLSENLKSLSERIHTLAALQHLSICELPNLESFAEDGGLPPNLLYFTIENCNRLRASVGEHWDLQGLVSLEEFTIGGRGSDDILEMLLKQQLLPSTLYILHINRLSSLKSLDRKGLKNITSLSFLSISKCFSREKSIIFATLKPAVPHAWNINLRNFPMFGGQSNLCRQPCMISESKLLHRPFCARFCKGSNQAVAKLQYMVSSNALQKVQVETGAEQGLGQLYISWNRPSILQPSADSIDFSIYLKRRLSPLNTTIGGRGSDDILETLLKEQLLPSTLHTLRIWGLSSLKPLDGKGLGHLTSLQELYISECDSIQFTSNSLLSNRYGLEKRTTCLRVESFSFARLLCVSFPEDGLPLYIAFCFSTKTIDTFLHTGTKCTAFLV